MVHNKILIIVEQSISSNQGNISFLYHPTVIDNEMLFWAINHFIKHQHTLYNICNTLSYIYLASIGDVVSR